MVDMACRRHGMTSQLQSKCCSETIDDKTECEDIRALKAREVSTGVRRHRPSVQKILKSGVSEMLFPAFLRVRK